MSLIGLSGIVKSFGGRVVLDGLELAVEEGARIGVLGRNGTGKSTLFRIMRSPMPGAWRGGATSGSRSCHSRFPGTRVRRSRRFSLRGPTSSRSSTS
jgi:ABC transport system ATP-binding/permease protein